MLELLVESANMRALFVGSMAEGWPDATKECFKKACRALGHEFAKASIGLVVGSDTVETSDRYVVEGAGYAKVHAEVIVCKPEPDGPNADAWRQWRPFSDREREFRLVEFVHKPVKGAWESTRIDQILEADVIVVIGDLPPESGTTQTAYAAPKLGRPVLIIPAFKASSAPIYSRFERDYELLGLKPQMNRFEGNWVGNNAKVVIDLVKKLVAENPYKISRAAEITTNQNFAKKAATTKRQFDVFLSHSSKDKPTVRKLAEELETRGLKVWLDEWELVPGRPWEQALEEIIQEAKSAVVLVGAEGIGPWEAPEIYACLSEFVKRQLPVIPVLLPGAPKQPVLPLFLRHMTWVDFRGGLTSESLNRLQWGITGQKASPSTRPRSRRAGPIHLETPESSD
jgi:nucleotide-binding universal stress UspA family protein